jgi:peptidoglycan/xylan/chitin deacetylase (PgdA/CDA1 family)
MGISGEPRLPILIFHRVLPEPDPLFPEEMHSKRFDALMGIVARSMQSRTLSQAASALQGGGLSARPVVITFDDGYADNAEVALPILQKHGLVASFFVSTGFLDGGRMWNDTVIECLRRSPQDAIDLADFGLGVFQLASPEHRRKAIDALLPVVKYQSLEERERSLALLHQRAGEPALPANLMMRSTQVAELHAAGMEIGAHTVRHPILQQVPLAEAEEEIAQGRARLQAITGSPVDVLAYPNGKPGVDYGKDHVALARRLGFRFAVSTSPALARAADDPLQLPRFTPWDQSAMRWVLRLALARRLVGAVA